MSQLRLLMIYLENNNDYRSFMPIKIHYKEENLLEIEKKKKEKDREKARMEIIRLKCRIFELL